MHPINFCERMPAVVWLVRNLALVYSWNGPANGVFVGGVREEFAHNTKEGALGKSERYALDLLVGNDVARLGTSAEIFAVQILYPLVGSADMVWYQETGAQFHLLVY